jgi:syntaxin-binding protein 5
MALIRHHIRATEDEDKPVACITLDEDDVNMVNGEKLAAGPHGPSIDREPIFKIVWSGYSNSDDPRGGTTTLAIVGGRNDGLQGVTVFHLPAFNPPEPPANTSVHESVHPVFRAAMRATVTPSDTYLYTTHTPVIDILLLPRDNPHFGSSFDPESILLLTEGHGGTKSLEARSFPPPQFNPTFNQATPTPAPSNHDTNDVEADLAATLAALTVVEEPAELELPPVLWSGKNAPEQSILVKLERDAHTKLTSGRKTTNSWRLDGGQAWAEETPDTRLIKVSFSLFLFYRRAPWC